MKTLDSRHLPTAGGESERLKLDRSTADLMNAGEPVLALSDCDVRGLLTGVTRDSEIVGKTFADMSFSGLVATLRRCEAAKVQPCFAVAVAGPILLGRERYLGGGLFAAE